MQEKIQSHFPFSTPREGQLEHIEKIIKSIENGKVNFIAELPTGVGKSPIAWTVGKVLQEINPINSVRGGGEIVGPPILIATSSRQLQIQYEKSFKNKGISYIWSSKNYPCINTKIPDYTNVHYYDGGCLLNKCNQFESCPYICQRERFFKSKIGVTNYHYLLNNCKLTPNVLICDEAHNLPNLLCDIQSIHLSEKGFVRLTHLLEKASVNLQINSQSLTDPLKLLCQEKVEELEDSLFREYITSINEEFRNYFITLSGEQAVLYDQICEISEAGTFPPDDLLREFTKTGSAITSLNRYLESFSTYLKSQTKWVVSEKDIKQTKLTVKPLEITEGMASLIKRSNKILYLSATICGPGQFAKELGLDFKTCDYSTANSIFPVENRRVFLTNSGSLNYKNKKEILPLFINKIDTIISKLTENYTKPYSGIIHSVSYENAEFIKQHSKFKDKIIIPSKEQLLTLNSIISKKKSGVIIVSPSILEGVDLVDDLSRFQIFLKVPYGFLGDRWVDTKRKLDPDWYAREAVIKMIQGCGRSIRSIDDWAWTFILDSNFSRLLNQYPGLFPTWFKDSMFRTEI